MTEPRDNTQGVSLESLLAKAAEKFDIRFEPITIGGETIEVLQIANMTEYIERLDRSLAPGELLRLPLWAKIWPTVVLMSQYIQKLDPSARPSLLEIGAGVGVCGLFAAKRGFDVTITDISPDALLFIKINILKNGLQDKAEVARADFTTDRLGRVFDYIVGSEAAYLDQTYRGLVKFLLAHLKNDPEAEVLLAKDHGRKAKKFFALADEEFKIAKRTFGFKDYSPEADQREQALTTIYRMRAKKHA